MFYTNIHICLYVKYAQIWTYDMKYLLTISESKSGDTDVHVNVHNFILKSDSWNEKFDFLEGSYETI